MNELMIPTEVLTANENGELVVKTEIGNVIRAIEEAQTFINNKDKELKELLLTNMLSSNITTARVDGYTISQVVPKSTFIFDKDGFIKDTSEDVVAEFVSITENETFDLEKFKSENPELYSKYVKKEDVVVVDEKKLSKSLPAVYNKYVTEVKNSKAITLRIAKAK